MLEAPRNPQEQRDTGCRDTGRLFAAGMRRCLLGMPAIAAVIFAPTAMLAVAGLVGRTALEDRMLRDDLPGHHQYAARVRHRLIPGVW